MNETLKNLRTRLFNIWNGWNQRQRRNVIISVSLLLVCFAVILWVVLRPNYVVVMSGLDASSLGQVQTKLSDLKIPNEIQGSSVLVPQRDADTARIQLATAGLPKQGYIGYNSIPNSFGMTQDQYNMQVLDVLQQSLDQTIQSIDGVVSAQVHIVMPDQQLFVSDTQQNTAKASVFVQVGDGVQLSGAQVAGIQQLVAHSVKGLSIDNVSVVDQNGVTLSQTGGAAGSAGVTDATEIGMRQQLEQQMNDKLTSGLAQIVGPGNAVVVVHADVTFNQTQSTTQNVLPAPGQSTGLITSQHVSRSTNNSGGSSAGGAAGQSSSNPNLPTYSGSSGGTGNSTSSSTDSTTNYVNGTQTIQTTSDPIQLNGYRVSVLVNSQNKSLTPQVISQIKTFVNNAVGSGTANSVSVTSVPFQAQPGIPAVTHSRVWLWAGIAAALAMLLVGGFLLMRRRSNRGAEEGGVSQLVPIEELPDESLAQNVNEDEQMRRQLAKLASQKPEEFANLVRTWLVSE